MLVQLRSDGRFDEARDMSRALWTQLGGDPRQHIEAAVSRQYAELFAAMPVPSYLTYGNVDLPKLWAEHARPGQHILDGERVQLAGWTFGFVGGGLRTTYRTPNEIDDDEFAAKVEAIGEVDVLCAHIPPDVPDLLYDTVARRMERGSEALLAAIREDPAAVRAVWPRAPAPAEPGADRQLPSASTSAISGPPGCHSCSSGLDHADQARRMAARGRWRSGTRDVRCEPG